MFSSRSRNATCSALDNGFTPAPIVSSVGMRELNPKSAGLQLPRAMPGEPGAGTRPQIQRTHFVQMDARPASSFTWTHSTPDARPT